jgi:hypothetical protein
MNYSKTAAATRARWTEPSTPSGEYGVPSSKWDSKMLSVLDFASGTARANKCINVSTHTMLTRR